MLWGLKDPLALRAIKGILVIRVLRARRVRQDHKALREIRALRALSGIRVHKDPLELMAKVILTVGHLPQNQPLSLLTEGRHKWLVLFNYDEGLPQNGHQQIQYSLSAN